MATLDNSEPKIIHVCNLTSKEQRERMAVLGKTIFKDAEQVIELEDGFELVFIKPVSNLENLIEFINFERQCCPTFSFELNFKPHNGPVHLKLIGGKDVKDEMITGLREYGHF